jgi:hypothetical protein
MERSLKRWFCGTIASNKNNTGVGAMLAAPFLSFFRACSRSPRSLTG